MPIVAHYLWFRKQETVIHCIIVDLLFELKAMNKIKLKSFGVLLLLAGAFFSSCTENEEAWFPVTGKGKVKTETRQHGSFTKVKSQINGNVSLHVTDNLDVTIQGPGVVYYSGTPQIQQNISGNGKMVEQN